MADTNKVVTLDVLSVFKDLMDSSVDEKVAAVDASALTYATEDEVTALFTDTTTE